MKTFSLLLSFCTFFFLTTVFAQNADEDVAAYAKIETNLGVMVFSLSNKTPKHTSNFIKLAKAGYFNTYEFNRVIKGFVIQGGETDSAYAAMEKEGKVLERINPEFNDGLFHQKGALAAGRDDNKEKTSFTGQIYVVDGRKYNDTQLDAIEKRLGSSFKFSDGVRKAYKEIGGTPSLDQNYTVFGQLVKGWDVLERIAGQPKSKSDKPLSKVTMKVKILSKKQAKSELNNSKS